MNYNLLKLNGAGCCVSVLFRAGRSLFCSSPFDSRSVYLFRRVSRLLFVS